MKVTQLLTKDKEPVLNENGEEIFIYELEVNDIIIPLKDSVYTKMQKYFDEKDGIEKEFPKHTLLVEWKKKTIFCNVNYEVKRILNSNKKNDIGIIGVPYKAYIRHKTTGNEVISIGRYKEIKKENEEN